MNATSAQQYLRTQRVIFAALLLAQLGFMGVAVVLLYVSHLATVPSLHHLLRWIVPLLDAGVVLLAWGIFRLGLRKARSRKALILKLQRYQVAFTITAALLEGINLFNVVAYLLTGNPYYLGLFLGVLALYLWQRPSIVRWQQHLDLTEAEVQELQQG